VSLSCTQDFGFDLRGAGTDFMTRLRIVKNRVGILSHGRVGSARTVESEGGLPHFLIIYGGDGDGVKQLLRLAAADEHGGAICLRCGPTIIGIQASRSYAAATTAGRPGGRSTDGLPDGSRLIF
jgi:hypothetical protein